MKKATENWLRSSAYDIRTAETLLKNRRYIYVVFLCHLSLEKTLKAILSEIHKELPPYTHNLNRLLELARITLPEQEQEFINAINLQSVPTRYPEDFNRLAKEYDKNIAEAHLKQAKRIISWLKRNTPQLKSGRS
jgi:HEPN domain-containing protein